MKEAVIKALSQVDDPDLKKDIVTLGMVQDLEVNGNAVTFRLVLTTPACPLKEVIKNACINAIHHLVDKNLLVNIILDAKVRGQERVSGNALSDVCNIIAVASGKGGVGKSTVAASLALALSELGAKVGLLDADIYGPSVPTMFGMRGTSPEIIQKGDKHTIIPFERFGIKLMSIGFLIDERQALVWRGPMVSTALKQLLLDVSWGELDYLIVDLPPGTGDIHLTLAQQFPLAGVLIVTTPQMVAVADTRKSIEMFKAPGVSAPILGIVENMSWFTPTELPDSKYYLFGKGGGQALSDYYGLPILGQLPLYQSLAEEADSGVPAILQDVSGIREEFYDIAKKVAQELSKVQGLAREKAGTI